MFIYFSNGHGSTFENSLDSGYSFASVLRDVERQRCWKRGSGDFGTTLRHDWAIFSSMPLTGEVRRSPEPFARPSAAADSEERQICTTCLFAESVGLCLCFLPSCAMYKDNAVRNVAPEMGRDLVFMITARLSDLSMPLKGEVRRSPVQSARQPIARSGKFVRRAYLRRALDCEKDDGLTCTYAFSCMLSPIVIVEHTSVWEGVGGRGEIWRGIPQSNTKDQLPKPQTATVATAQRPK